MTRSSACSMRRQSEPPKHPRLGRKRRERERGMSVGNALVILLIIGVVATLAIRLIPHYIDYNTIIAVLDGMTVEDLTQSRGRTFQKIEKNLKLNNIREWNYREAITLERNAELVTLIVHYEVREPLVGNVDMMLTFDKTLEKPR